MGEAVLGTGVDLSGLNTGLGKAEGQTKSAFSRIGNIMDTAMGTALGVITGQAIPAMLGGIKNAFDSAFKSNDNFEQYKNQFTVLLKDAEAAKKRLNELSAVADKTPFPLDQVVKADLILQGFGLHSEEAAKKFGFTGERIRTIAGDLAAGTRTSFEEMAGLIGRFASGDTGDAIRRMQELGIATKEQLAAMGLEFSKSGELLSPLPEATNVVLSLMEEKYGGLMDIQSQTFSGMQSTLDDFINNTLRKLSAPLFDKAKEQLANLLAFLNSDTMKAALASVEKMVTAFANNDMAGVLAQIEPLVTNLAMSFGLSSGEAETLFTNLKTAWTDFQTILGTVWAELQPLFTDLWNILSVEGGKAIELFKDAWAKLLPDLQAFWAWAQENLFPKLAELWNWFKVNLPPAIETVANFITGTLLPAVLNFTDWYRDTAGPALAELWKWFETNIPAAMKTLSDFWTGTLQPALQAGWDWMSGTLFPFLESLANVVDAVLGLAVRELTRAWEEKLQPALEKVHDFFKENIEPIIKNVAAALDEKLSPALKTAHEFISGSLNSALNTLKTAFDGITNGIKLATEWLGKLADAIRNIPNPPPVFTPGSPTPFERGLRGITDAALELADSGLYELTARFGHMDLAFDGAGRGDTHNTYWQLTAEYKYQNERSLRDEVRMLALLG